MYTLRNIGIFCTAIVMFLLVPEAAWALTCDGSGGVAGGNIYGTTGVCDRDWTLENMFSRVFCDFVTIVNDVLSKVFCSIQYALTTTLGALFTLYLAVFGAQILMGTVQLTSKEVMVRLLKIAGVWAFVTQTYWAIGLAFTFFYTMAIYASIWVWGGLNAAGQNPYSITVEEEQSIMPIFNFFDDAIYQAITGPFTMANSEVIGFFFVMWYLIPTLFFMAAYWLWLNLVIMIRAVLTFLIAVASLAFLLALSPIFLSFMLFAVTYQFFENWLKYMMSYSLQVVVVFACVGLWVATASLFVGFFNELSETIFPYSKLWVKGAPESDPVNTWSICPVTYTYDALGPHATCENPAFDPVNVVADRDEAIPASRIAQQGEFVYYIIYRLVTLIIISFAFDALMRQAPYIAKSLAGPEYVPILGQGYGFSKYGLINKTPAWLRRGGSGQSITRSIDKELGISKTAKSAVASIGRRYNQNIGNLLGKR